MDADVDVDRLIGVLCDVVATEVACYLRYSQHALAAIDLESMASTDRAEIATEFSEHAAEEMQHGMWAAERVSQLGGDPGFDPTRLAEQRGIDMAVPTEANLAGMVEEKLVAEQMMVDSYQEIVDWIGDGDPTTRRLMERIIERQEEHAGELAELLAR